MARYTGPVCKFARREGCDLEHKSGIKSLDSKCRFKTPPGTGHGARMRGKPSDYQIHLRAKQRMRRYYGVLERQFRGYFKRAAAARGDTGEKLLRLLESRLDNCLFRMGFATTRSEARQTVTHGHVVIKKHDLVDGNFVDNEDCQAVKVDIPSFLVGPGHVVAIAEKSRRQHGRMKDVIANAELRADAHPWLEVNISELSGKVIAVPDISELDIKMDVNLVVEYYSK